MRFRLRLPSTLRLLRSGLLRLSFSSPAPGSGSYTMGGMRLRESANQPLGPCIRQDFSREADHLWGTGAWLLRKGHHVHVTTAGDRRRQPGTWQLAGHDGPRSPPPQQLLLRSASAAGAGTPPPALSQSAVFEYDSPGAVAAPATPTPKPAGGARKLLPPLEAGGASDGGAAQVLRNLDRYLEHWTGGARARPGGLDHGGGRGRGRAASSSQGTATEVGADLSLSSAGGSGSPLHRPLSPMRAMRSRQTAAVYGAWQRR